MDRMMKVSRAEVRSIVESTFPAYRGRTFSVSFAGVVTLYDLNWGGGSRNQYAAVELGTGRTSRIALEAPWFEQREGARIEIPRGFVVVRHGVCCGKDTGITIYASPADAPKWLASGAEVAS